MSKIYINDSYEPIIFEDNFYGIPQRKVISKGDKIIVKGDEISFSNGEYTRTPFSEVSHHFSRYWSAEEKKEIKEFKKQAAIAAMQALIRRQDDTAEHITELAMEYAESITNKMFE